MSDIKTIGLWAHVAIVAAVGLTATAGCKSRKDQAVSALSSFMNSKKVAPESVDGVPVVGESDLTLNRNVRSGLPVIKDGDDNSLLLLSRPQFVVAFDTQSKVPVWTAWELAAKDIGSVDRADSFRSDDILNEYIRLKRNATGVDPSDYTNTCFDRGHQSPSKDRSVSESDNNATFYMSNMAPQTAFLNRGIWKSLEDYSRTLVEDKGKRLQIIGGPILKDGRERIGTNSDIAVPEAYFKIIVVYENAKEQRPEGYLAVIMPNVTSDGLDPLANKDQNCGESKGKRSGSMSKDWKTYRATLANIEQKSRMTFPKLAGVPEI